MDTEIQQFQSSNQYFINKKNRGSRMKLAEKEREIIIIILISPHGL